MHLIDYHVGNLGEEKMMLLFIIIIGTYLQVSVNQPVHLKIIIVLSKRIDKGLCNLEVFISYVIAN